MPRLGGLCTFLDKDAIKENYEKDPKFAFKQYVSVYHACFKPATLSGPWPYGWGSSSYFRRIGIKECYERLKKRDLESLRTAALGGKGDDMIEYCLRCVMHFCSTIDVRTIEPNRLLTGAKAPLDEDTAYALLCNVIRGRYTHTQRAIAANLACIYFKCRLSDDRRRNSAHAFLLADISCGKCGLFTWNVLHLIQLYEWQKENPETQLPSLTHLWREYAEYREDSGIQRLTKKLCSKCGKPAGVDMQMKECSGECRKERKPVYCSRDCQKAVS